MVDTTVPKVAYDDVTKRPQPLQLKLSVEFQRNGQPFPNADAMLRDNAERVLRASGVIVPVASSPEGEIRIVVNNIADMGDAVAKGFGSGLTLGLVGTTVTDAYQMEVTLTSSGKTIRRDNVKHALHTAIGNTTFPEGTEVLEPATAFGRVVEQMLLRVLRDMQQSGDLSWLRAPGLAVVAHLDSGYRPPYQRGAGGDKE